MAESTIRPTCRFCKSQATVLVALSDGCVCFPDDRQQYLCDHHLNRATPLGTLDVVWDARDSIK